MNPGTPATQPAACGLQIELRSLRLGAQRLLGPARWHIAPGSVHTLMGPSGCGKSSLLAAIAGHLEAPLQFDGAVWLDARCLDPLPPEQRRIGLLFQDDLLFPHLSVGENLLFGVRAAHRAERAALLAQALHELELPGLQHADPASLSGGQRARVALMRTLLARPQALLLDEPFSRLDAGLRQRMRERVFAQVRAHRLPTLLVTHDPQDVADPAQVTDVTDLSDLADLTDLAEGVPRPTA